MWPRHQGLFVFYIQSLFLAGSRHLINRSLEWFFFACRMSDPGRISPNPHLSHDSQIIKMANFQFIEMPVTYRDCCAVHNQTHVSGLRQDI